MKTLRVGICGTDYHAFKGNFPFLKYPIILGHELCVEVLDIDSDNSHGIKVGDRCAVEPYLNCGSCHSCRIGRYNCCSELKVLGVHQDGGMQESFVLRCDKLHLANYIEEDHVAITEMLAVGAHAVSRAGEMKGKKVLVIGAGPIGLAVANFAILAQAKVTVVDLIESRSYFAAENLDVTALCGKLGQEEVKDHLGSLPEIVFDATGNRTSMENSFSLVDYSGQLIFVGLVADYISFDNPLFHSHEMTLKSSRNATSKDFKYVLKTLYEGTTKVNNWISHYSSFADFPREIERWKNGDHGVIKGILKMD